MSISNSLNIKSGGRVITALAKLLYFKPAYLFLTLGVSVLFYEIVYWILNIGLAQHITQSSTLTVADRIDMVIGSYMGLFTFPPSGMALLLFGVSTLQGLTVAVLVYTVRHNRQQAVQAKDVRVLGVAGVLSIIGLGCAACGTSLVLPVITWVFATSSVALVDAIGFYSLLVAFIVSVLATYFAGKKMLEQGLPRV